MDHQNLIDFYHLNNRFIQIIEKDLLLEVKNQKMLYHLIDHPLNLINHLNPRNTTLIALIYLLLDFIINSNRVRYSKNAVINVFLTY